MFVVVSEHSFAFGQYICTYIHIYIHGFACRLCELFNLFGKGSKVTSDREYVEVATGSVSACAHTYEVCVVMIMILQLMQR